MSAPAYNRAERLALEAALNSDQQLLCPVCGAALNSQPIAPPPGVSYVRHRIWVLCPGCKRTAALDKR